MLHKLAIRATKKDRVGVEAREIERVAEELGLEVERWLSEQQDQIVLRSGLPLADKPSIPKPYVSFDGTDVLMRKSELLAQRQTTRCFSPHP